jgi:hypothetical protein
MAEVSANQKEAVGSLTSNHCLNSRTRLLRRTPPSS